MFRSTKSMRKHSPCTTEANPTQPTSQLNQIPNLIQSPLSLNALLGSTLQPNPQTSTNSLNHSLSPTPDLDSLGSLLNESQFQSFTSLLQPALSTQPTPLPPISNPSLPLSLPSLFPPPPNIDLFEDELDTYGHKLLEKVEIVDESGKIVRIEEMCVKDVHKLEEGEKILVHVDELSQPIKAAGGLCTRFMTSLLRQPNLCGLDARTFREVKRYSGAKLAEELRAKFSLPCTTEMDKVIMSKFSGKFRIVKWRLKDKLLNIAKQKIKENRKADGVYVEDEEKQYTSEQLLQALDIIERPSGFVDHQWEKFKANLRDDKAQELSKKGKEARKTQVHTHTTGSISYARKKDMIKLEKKRKPTEVEFFEITHQTKNGSYAHKESKELMEKVNELIKQKTNELGISGPLNPKLQSEIHSEVWKELMEDENSRKPIGYGVGVTKTQVSKLSDDLRRIRNDSSGSNEIHALRKVVSVQENQIRGMRNILHYLVSQAQNPQAPCEIYSNVNMDPTLLANIGLSQSQGRVVDHDSNSNETAIPSPHIPSP